MLETERTVAPLVASGRCLVVYFEQLKADLTGELDRIAAFLGLPLSPAKRAAIADAVSLKGMEGNMMVRKGEIMDWKNHMDDERWALVDETIKETLQGSALYKPLEQYAQR